MLQYRKERALISFRNHCPVRQSHKVYTSNKEINPSTLFNFLFIFVTLLLKVWCISIQNVYIDWVNVDMTEKLFPHVGVVTLWVVRWDADILVHVKGLDILEGYLPSFMELNELLIHSQWSATCGAHNNVQGNLIK